MIKKDKVTIVEQIYNEGVMSLMFYKEFCNFTPKWKRHLQDSLQLLAEVDNAGKKYKSICILRGI